MKFVLKWTIMETIIKKSGLIFFRLNQKLKWIFNIRILRNHNTTILFILFVCFSVVFLSFLGIGFSFSHTITYSLVSTAVLFLNLILIGSLNEARKLSKQASSNCFQFSRNNSNGVRLPDLGFIERDRENLNLVLNGLEPENKIDFKLVSDNRAAADYKKLFRILHLLIDGGIKDFKRERKDQLFKFVESTFTLNGSLVNRASLNSRFSEWVNESDSDFSEHLKVFQKILD